MRLDTFLLLLGSSSGGTLTPPFNPATVFDRYWSPFDATNLKMNANGTGAVTANGDLVKWIADQSSNTDHGIYDAGSTAAVYRPTGINAHPALDVSSTQFNFTDLALINFTVIAVLQTSVVSIVGYFLWGADGSGGFLGDSNAGIGGWGEVTLSGSTKTRTATDNPLTPHIYVYTPTQLFIDGVEATYSTTDTLAAFMVDQLYQRSAADFSYKGLAGPVGIKASLLSATNINLVGNYLSTQYGISWTNIPS